MSKKFIIEIDTDNAAFDEGNTYCEIARILRAYAGIIDNGEIVEGRSQPLRDYNGNTVGTAKYVEGEEESTFQGYTNYQTFQIGLFIDNERGVLSQVHGWIREYDGDVRKVAEEIREFIESKGERESSPFTSTLVSGALSLVNWKELAEEYIDLYEDEEEETV